MRDGAGPRILVQLRRNGCWAPVLGGSNVANGNLVVQQADTTPVQGNGRLLAGQLPHLQQPERIGCQVAERFRRRVDAQHERSWRHDGCHVAVRTSRAARPCRERAAVGDDDRSRWHTPRLHPKGLAAGFTPVVPSAATPLVLSAGTAKLCVDQTYQAPPGVHLGLFRYVQVALGSSCSPATWTAPVVLGFGAVRPDRVRTEFNTLGQLLATRDANGNTLRYSYDAPLSGARFGRLRTVWEPASNCTDGNQALCRALKINYVDDAVTPVYRADVTDPAGRITRYVFDAKFGLPGGRLVRVENPDGPGGAVGTTVNYTYTSCGGGANQLCSLTDPRGATARFSYAAGPSGPARVAQMGHRRSATLGDAFTTVFSYNSGYTDVTRDGTLRRFQGIDSAGRVGRVLEGTAPAGPFLRDTTFTWDTSGARCTQPDSIVDNNLCQIRRAALDGGSDEVTTRSFTADGLPLIERRTVTGGDLVTTWGYKTQAVRSAGTLSTPTASRVTPRSPRCQPGSATPPTPCTWSVTSPRRSPLSAMPREQLSRITGPATSATTTSQLSPARRRLVTHAATPTQRWPIPATCARRHFRRPAAEKRRIRYT